ncbi:MAG: NnrS family protein [Proteobacteria bacterium]|nr:NnrS family protein [Pseudomonadota bacterium]
MATQASARTQPGASEPISSAPGSTGARIPDCGPIDTTRSGTLRRLKIPLPLAGERVAPTYGPNWPPRGALWAKGFRPFFLGAALLGALLVPLWIGMLRSAAPLPGSFDPISWHAHEMLFGYAVAVLAGFLLTAVARWTRITSCELSLLPAFSDFSSSSPAPHSCVPARPSRRPIRIRSPSPARKRRSSFPRRISSWRAPCCCRIAPRANSSPESSLRTAAARTVGTPSCP